MPVSNEMLKKAIWDVKEIRQASVDLRRDEDGAVRRTCALNLREPGFRRSLRRCLVGVKQNAARTTTRPYSSRPVNVPRRITNRGSTLSRGRPSRANRKFWATFMCCWGQPVREWEATGSPRRWASSPAS